MTVRPPLYTSTSKVLLPPAPALSNGEKASWEATTQVSIAQSDAVLGPASRSVTPSIVAPGDPRAGPGQCPHRRRAHRSRHGALPAPPPRIWRRRSPRQRSPTKPKRRAPCPRPSWQACAPVATTSRARSTPSTNRSSGRRTGWHTEDPDSPHRAPRRQRAGPADRTADRPRPGDRRAGHQDRRSPGQHDRADHRGVLPRPTGRSCSRRTSSPRSAWPLLGGTFATLVLLILSRRDAKLGTRDEISDAVGSAVIASLRSEVPRSVAAWTSLLGSYTPSVVEGWTLRQALAQFGLERPRHGRAGPSRGSHVHRPRTCCA